MSKIKVAPGLILTKELDPQDVSKITAGSSYQLSPEGGNPHDQLKLSEVLDVGGPRTNEYGTVVTTDVKPGNIIAFQSLSAHKLRIDGVQYLLVPAEHVMAIITGVKSGK